MCTNQRYIKNCYGKEILVKCGHCSACLQEKAIARTNRIRNSISVDYIPLFLTLTYRNECIPYIKHNELLDDNGLYNLRCNVYRDSAPVYERVNGEYDTKLNLHEGNYIIGNVVLPFGKCKCNDKFISFHGASDFSKIGVSWYADVQNFVKKLKLYLFRYYGLSNTFSYYICTEYGPSSQRPHIHAVLYCKKSSFDFQKYKRAVAKAWSFCDIYKFPRSVEIATNVSSYIASYVNSSNSLPDLFTSCSEFKQKHSYSHAFGMANPAFSLENIQQAFNRRSLKYSVSKVRNGVQSIDNILLPKYVISRYCPQHKGFNRLTSFEIERIVLRPSEIFRYSETLGIDLKQCYQIEIQYRNRLRYAVSHGINKFDFARMYSQIWSIRATEVIKDMYKDIKNYNDYFTLYDNISDLYNGNVTNYTLFALIDNTIDTNLLDYNKFPSRVSKSLRLTDSYHVYNKNRKIRNFILSQNHYM